MSILSFSLALHFCPVFSFQSREDKENFGYGERFPLKKSVSVSSFLSESSDSSATNTTQCSGITRRKVAR